MDEHRKIKAVDDIENKENPTLEIPTEPCRAMCEICRKEVTTYVKSEFSVWVWLLTLCVLYFYGFKFGFVILLVSIPLFKNVIHSCPYCLDVLMVKNFYPIQVKEKYCWLQYGKCVIILRLMYIYLILVVLLAWGFYYNITYIFSNEIKTIYHDHSHDIDEKVKGYYSGSDLAWNDLIKDCGSYVMTENSARANEIFSRRYFKRIIEWKGYFLNAFVQSRNPLDFNPDHLMNINVRMIPSESIRNPDLFLSLDYKKYVQYGQLIRTFSTGTPIKFKASLEALGNEWRSHHLHLISIEQTEEFVDHDHKVVLFQGINFNITGHIKNEEEIEFLQSAVQSDSVNNSTTSNETTVESENVTDSDVYSVNNSTETIVERENVTDSDNI